MIFRIKHQWWMALLAIVVGALLSWWFGGWHHLTESPWTLSWQIVMGILAGALSIGCDGTLHEIFKRTLGRAYLEAFHRHGCAVLGLMRWPEYITAGLMAGIAEEPLFRGALLSAIDSTALGVASAALVFAICHWMRLEFLLFWFWALLEGVLFGVLMVITGSLLVAMIAHGIHDLVGYRVFQRLIRDRGEQAVRS